MQNWRNAMPRLLSSSARLMRTLMLSVPLSLAVASCGSTGVVRADLDDPGTQALRKRVERDCASEKVAPAWTVPKASLDQSEVEKLALRDGDAGQTCADSAIAYKDHITARDRSLMAA